MLVPTTLGTPGQQLLCRVKMTAWKESRQMALPHTSVVEFHIDSISA